MQGVGTSQPDFGALSAIWGNCLSPRLPGQAEDISKSGLGGGGNDVYTKLQAKMTIPQKRIPALGRHQETIHLGRCYHVPEKLQLQDSFLRALVGTGLLAEA